MKTLKTGGETLSYCTRCRMDLNHTIVAMQGDRVLKVQCRTCRGDHVYRPPKGITVPDRLPSGERRIGIGESPSRSAPRAPSASRRSVEDEWQDAMRAQVGKTALPYSPTTAFQVHDKLKHPTFGEGVVQRLLHPKKIEVLFSMDLKILIHGGAS